MLPRTALIVDLARLANACTEDLDECKEHAAALSVRMPRSHLQATRRRRASLPRGDTNSVLGGTRSRSASPERHAESFLDHVLILGKPHPRHLVTEYVRFRSHARPNPRVQAKSSHFRESGACSIATRGQHDRREREPRSQVCRKGAGVVGLYLNPPDNAVLLSIDEKSRPMGPPTFHRVARQESADSLHYTPTSASWLNHVEGFFGILAKPSLSIGNFPSKLALRQPIDAFLAGWNDHPTPFRWTKPAQAIIRSHRGMPARISVSVH
jgi:hypothetical protein